MLPLQLIQLISFIDLFGVSIVTSLLPLFANRAGLKNEHYGFLPALYGVLQFLFAPVFGHFSDFYGRRFVLALSALMSAFCYFALSSKSLFLLIAGRVIIGIFRQSSDASAAYAADISSAEQRSEFLAKIQFAMHIPFLFGPILGGIFYESNPVWPVLLASFCFVFELIPIYYLPESIPVKSKLSISNSFFSIFRNRSLLFLSSLAFINTSLKIIVSMALLPFLKSSFDITPVNYTVLISIQHAFSAISQGVAVPWLCKKFTSIIALPTDKFIIAVAFLIVFVSRVLSGLFVPSIFIYILWQIPEAVGCAILNTCIKSMVTKEFSDNTGAALGAIASANSLSRIVAPITSSFLSYSVSPSSPFLYSSILSLAMSIFLFSRTSKEKSL